MEVLNLKEAEKYGKKKGIVPKSIKDVLQSLVDDGLVEQDKIGVGSLFWSLPYETLSRVIISFK